MSSRPRWLLPAVAVAGLVVIVVVMVVFVLDDETRDLRAGSVPTDDEPGLYPVAELPERYRIDYRVEGLAGDAPVVTVDRLWVQRPFESRLESFDGEVAEGEPTSVQISAFGRLRAEGAGTQPAVLAAPPGPGVSDIAIGPALDRALDDGRIELRERREVHGRPCQVVRSATQLVSGDLSPPGARDHVDTCFDEHGLVLEELVVVDGRPLLRKVATDVEVEPALDDVSFAAGEPTVPPRDGGGFVAELVPGTRQPGTFFEPQRPAGFDERGRFLVIPAQHENFTDPTRRGQRLTYVSDVFVDGPAVVVVDQGGTLGNVDPFPDLTGVDIDADIDIDDGGSGTATLTYGQGGPVLVVPRPEGRFLRVRGNVDVAVLVRVLEGLEEVEGGELQLLDDAG